MADDLIGLFPKEPEKDLGEPDPKYASIKAISLPSRRDSGTAFFVDIAVYYVPTAIAVSLLRHHRGGWPIAAAIGYTLTIPFILSNRYLRRVPWDSLRKYWKKFLAVHCAVLIPVCAITSVAFAAKPRLPDWFITSGRKPALFYYCLGGVLLALAFWECSYMSKYKERSEEADGADNLSPR